MELSKAGHGVNWVRCGQVDCRLLEERTWGRGPPLVNQPDVEG